MMKGSDLKLELVRVSDEALKIGNRYKEPALVGML